MDGIFFESKVDRAIAAAATANEFRNVLTRWSELLGRTVQDEETFPTQADAVADIVEQQEQGWQYRHTIIVAEDGTEHRLDLSCAAYMLQREREVAELYERRAQVLLVHTSF
jgi:hypothetical protein